MLKGSELKTVRAEVTLSKSSVIVFINAESSFRGGAYKDTRGRRIGEGKTSGCVKKRGNEKGQGGGERRRETPTAWVRVLSHSN